MLTILDKMYKKRFNLTTLNNIENYENGIEKINNNYNSSYNHVACIIENTSVKKARILSYGFNSLGDKEGIYPGVHAECDALLKLKYLNNKKLKSIDLIVIRISSTNKLKNSKPCSHCISIMNKIAIKKGYNINKILYSDGNNNLIEITLNALNMEDKHYSRFYRQERFVK